MDKINKSIIHQLSINSKAKLKDFTGNLPISKQSLLNRINYLIKDQYISPYTITNYFNLGKKNVHIHIKFEKINLSEINNIVLELTKKKSVVWVAETFHKYDLSIAVIYKNFKIVEDLVSEITKLSSNNIKKIDTIFIKENYYFSYNFNSNDRKVIKIHKTRQESLILRKKEDELLKIISSEGRFKLTELGNLLNLSANSVKYLIKELEKKEIILGYGGFINYLKLDYKWFQIEFEIYQDIDPIKKLLHFENIVFISRVFDSKIIIDFVSKNTTEVRDFVNEIERIIGKINNYEIYEILKIHKLEDPNLKN
ncbi:MAG: Lrp/AsnC family transcriptional regulator [Candidatus Woesearchaeota archaeon]|jgi:DNA-binding Lrp family transcriptional regulator|nr:Lrp/AsnC family transcriptional regulator [Candidatus Woesearchaeota archaeon]